MQIGHGVSHVSLWLALLLGAALAVASCSKQGAAVSTALPEPAVTSIELGTAIDEDTFQITMPGSTFAPGDRIYASIATAGPGIDGDEVKMDADWIYQDGQTVSHSSHTGIVGNSKPDLESATQPGGFAPGKYKLEIKLNGATAATKEFAVK